MEYTSGIMNTKKIKIVDDYSPFPYGRYTREVQPGEEDTTGERFRNEILIPALQKFEKVHIDLSGYNRYGRSFIDEAFGGLISSGAYTLAELKGRLTYEHDVLLSIIKLIDERMQKAENDRIQKLH